MNKYFQIISFYCITFLFVIPAFAADNTPPSVPTRLSVAAVSPTQANLTWDPSVDNIGVIGYKIYRDGVLLTSIASTSYADTGLATNNAYSYQVSAYDMANNVSAMSVAVRVEVIDLAHVIPVNVGQTVAGSITIKSKIDV